MLDPSKDNDVQVEKKNKGSIFPWALGTIILIYFLFPVVFLVPAILLCNITESKVVRKSVIIFFYPIDYLFENTLPLVKKYYKLQHDIGTSIVEIKDP